MTHDRPRGADTWVDVGLLTDLPVDRAIAVAAGSVVVVRDREGVTAWRNRCGHRDLSMAGGLVADGILTCPHHLWRYRTTDGACVAGGRDVALAPVDVVVEGGRVRIRRPLPPPSLVEVLRANARQATPPRRGPAHTTSPSSASDETGPA